MEERPPPLWHGLLAGGAAACTSRLITYPPDTVKARLQVQGSGAKAAQYRGTAHAFITIARLEGVRGFYRGFGAILSSVIPANMFYFGGYELGKRLAPKNLGVLSDMATATVAQTIAGVAFNPIDVIKQKLQTEAVRQGSSSGALEAVRDVYRNQGLPGFWRGFLVMNTLWLPWNLVYLTLYESSKRRLYYHYQAVAHKPAAVSHTAEGMPAAPLPTGQLLPASALQASPSSSQQLQWDAARPHNSSSSNSNSSAPGVEVHRDPPLHEVLPWWAFPLCSGACSATASICTHPLDVVKTRLQVLTTGSNSQEMNAWQVASDLWRREGLRGFRRGMAARTLTMASGSAVSWTTYELVKRQLAKRREA